MKDFHRILEEIRDTVFAEDRLPDKADVIFLPGNGYPDMAERAAELYREGRAPWVLPSGKYSVTKGRFERQGGSCDAYGSDFGTEWEFLRDVLMKNGVPKQAILREDRATFTYENAVFSRNVTDQAGLAVKKAILCCKNYHAGRALLYYRLLYPETEFAVTPVAVDAVTRENWADSREGIDKVMEELERILCQFSLMMKMK